MLKCLMRPRSMEEAPLSFRESEMILNSQLDKKVDRKIGII